MPMRKHLNQLHKIHSLLVLRAWHAEISVLIHVNNARVQLAQDLAVRTEAQRVTEYKISKFSQMV